MTSVTAAVTPPSLILGSSSRYRRALLERFGLPFTVDAPDIDETPHAGELPRTLALRLAQTKAQRIAARHPEAVVIGSDQVVDLDGEAVSKPGDHARATAQLQRLSGRTVTFYTGLAVICAARGFHQTDMAEIHVRFRALDDATIERYLLAERPYDCAGSAKSEGLGITLLESLESDDPTALIGLPLIRTARLLRAAGIMLP